MKKMQSQNTSNFFSDMNLSGNIAVLYLGGSDTVTSSPTWLFRLMAKYPEIQKKVQDELDEVLGQGGTITYEDKHKIPYTYAVMQEAQRISSIVPLASIRRAITNFKVRDYTIPEGALIVANMWAVHHDPSYWPNPEEFTPEKFLVQNEDGSRNNPRILAFPPAGVIVQGKQWLGWYYCISLQQ